MAALSDAGIPRVTAYRHQRLHPRLWPFALDPFDRDPVLRPAERTAIESAFHARNSRTPLWIRPSESRLSRLLKPIDAVLDYIEVPPMVRTAVKVALLRGMLVRSSSFWAWATDDWVDFLGRSYREYETGRIVTQECRSYLVAFAYIAGGMTQIHLLGQMTTNVLAERVFGRQAVEVAVQRIRVALVGIGYAQSVSSKRLLTALCKVLLLNGSPRLEDITAEVLLHVRHSFPARDTKEAVVPLSRALLSMGIVSQEIEPRLGGRRADTDTSTHVPCEWAEYVGRWRDTTTLEPGSYQGLYYNLMKVGRWITANDLTLSSPAA